MGRIASVKKLPATVFQELNERLVASGFGDIVAITQWLTDSGFTIGKSAVGEYARKSKEEIKNQTGLYAERRMKCLEIASRTPGVTDFVAEAERLLRFIYGS